MDNTWWRRRWRVPLCSEPVWEVEVKTATPSAGSGPRVGWRKSAINWAVFLAVYVPLCFFVLGPASKALSTQFRDRFPAFHEAQLRIFMTLAPWVLVGLLVFYAIQSVRAFREGMREGRRRSAGSQHG
jgi:hypothetical protein